MIVYCEKCALTLVVEIAVWLSKIFGRYTLFYIGMRVYSLILIANKLGPLRILNQIIVYSKCIKVLFVNLKYLFLKFISGAKYDY